MASGGGVFLFFGGGALLGLGLILHIVGTATNEWATADKFPADVTFGLFKLCFGKVCRDYDESEGAQKGYDSLPKLCITAIVLSALGCGLVLASYLTSGRAYFGVILAVLSLLFVWVAGILIFASVIVFTVIYEDDLFKFSLVRRGYSFGLTVAGGILIVLGGGLAITGVRIARPDQPGTQGQRVSACQQPYVIYQPHVERAVFQQHYQPQPQPQPQQGGMWYPQPTPQPQYNLQAGGWSDPPPPYTFEQPPDYVPAMKSPQAFTQ